MAFYSVEKMDQSLAKVEKTALENNGGKPLPKYWLPSMRVVLIEAVTMNGQEKQELNNKIDELTTQVSTQDKDLCELKNNNSDLTSQVRILTEDNEKKDKIINDLRNETIELQHQADSSSQYNRCDNFKITGIPQEVDENLYDIAQSVTKHIGREMKIQEISDIHRLPSETGVPGIICRVNRRSVKHEILDKKKHLRSYPHPQYSNIGIYEDLHH